MKKGILITLFILLTAISMNAQDKWVEKSEGGEKIEKEMIFFKDTDGKSFEFMSGGCGQGKHGGMMFMGECGDMGKGHSGKGMFSMLRHAEMLGLTEDQITKIKDMKYNFSLSQIDQKAAIKKAQLKLGKSKRDEVSENKIFAAIDDVSKLKAEMHKMMYKHHQSVKNLLTDEQKEKIKELKKGKVVKRVIRKGMKHGSGHPF